MLVFLLFYDPFRNIKTINLKLDVENFETKLIAAAYITQPLKLNRNKVFVLFLCFLLKPCVVFCFLEKTYISIFHKTNSCSQTLCQKGTLNFKLISIILNLKCPVLYYILIMLKTL
jgi:hypothetical protein